MARSALVTGGARGIGAGIARCLVAEKVVDEVVVLDAARPPAAHDPAIRHVQCDVSDPGAVERALDALDAPPDVLVNNVGGERPPAVTVDDPTWPPVEVWEDIVGLNLTTAYDLARRVRDRLESGAAICNVASIAGLLPWVVSPAYGAAKAALIHWTQTAALALAPRGIRVNAVAPGFVRTWQWRSVDDAEFARVVDERVPLARAEGSKEQTADDVGACVAFLCSPRAAHVTGQVVCVDGGAALARAPR